MKEKIKTIGKVCKILAKIMTVMMIIATAGLVIAGSILVAIPNSAVEADVTAGANVTVRGEWIDRIPQDQIDKISEKIDDGSVHFNVNSSKVNDIEKSENTIVVTAMSDTTHYSLRRIGFALFCYALVTGALIAVFIMLDKLMKALETEDSPFTDNVVKKMTNFAISLIPYAVLKSVATSAGNSLITTGQFDFNFGVNLSTAFTVLVIILLIMIFKHGAQIQKESDETL